MPILLLLIGYPLTENGVQAFTTKRNPNPLGSPFFGGQHQQQCGHVHCKLFQVLAPPSQTSFSVLSATKIKDVACTSTETQSNQKPSESKHAVSHLENDANLSTVTVNNPTWDQNIAAMLEYKEIHGTVNIPTQSKEYPKLALWIKNMRHYNGRLAREQVAQLDSIGLLWTDAKMDKHERMWLVTFEELKEYKATHGHCRVPIKDGCLGTWVKTQRRQYTTGKLRRDRQEMLESIGFEWRLKRFVEVKNPEQETLWNSQYAKVVRFKEEYGHTRVPYRYPENPEVGIWVHIQRNRNKNGTLRPDRKAKLDEIGFVWDISEYFWDTQYDALVKYKERHGDTRVPRDNPENKELGFWVGKQRQKKKNDVLRPDRKERLDGIGFVWDSRKHTWGDQYDALVKYKEKHGDTLVPRDYPENKDLGFWVATQRQNMKNGTLLARPDRKAKLDALGFVWDFDDILGEAWLERYENLKWCYANNANFDRSLNTSWTKRQRIFSAKGLLAPHRKALLDEIGFDW
ncbi:helicase [Seminavis robusta]|uniref:Helicase n=1 Tax=Seminavis robusta TaxID=568900 RepID=A0A9N8EQN1_9STRA|nr:helicase [Seminavis robusta]|eukprot:Sro1798_g298280.1 helicase (515) ;mRNA; r:15296-16840